MFFGQHISPGPTYEQVEVQAMKTSMQLLGIALVALLVTAGLAAAGGFGQGVAAGDGERPTNDAGNGVGQAADADRPFDGSNSPWVTDDERLERFQERFGLTGAQMEQVRAEVTAMFQNGADHEAVREQVRAMLQEFGVDDRALGPMAGERIGDVPFGHGPADAPHQGNGPGDDTVRQGGNGGGPHGVADGSCTS